MAIRFRVLQHLHMTTLSEQEWSKPGLGNHLSREQIDVYVARRLSSEELICIDDHLTECDVCRRHIENALPGSALTLYADLEGEARADTGAPHPTFDQLAGCTDETLARDEVLFVKDHVVSCVQCADALDDLSAFRDKAARAPTRSPTVAGAKHDFLGRARGVLRMPAVAFSLAAAAVLVIVVGGWLMSRVLEQRPRTPAVADQGSQPVSPSVAPSVVETPAPAGAPLLARLTDGTGQVTLDTGGTLSGLEKLPEDDQKLIKNTLLTGRLSRPDSLAGLKRRSTALMNPGNQRSQFSLVFPVGKVTLTDRPTLRWTALSGANSYVVEVYDERSTLVQQSQSLQRTEWTPPDPLTRGRVYAWQVKATQDGREVLAPAPPVAQARFRVAAQAEAARIARAQRTYPESHLTLGLLYFQAGLLDEAERELDELHKSNSDVPIVRRLLTQVRAMRR